MTLADLITKHDLAPGSMIRPTITGFEIYVSDRQMLYNVPSCFPYGEKILAAFASCEWREASNWQAQDKFPDLTKSEKKANAFQQLFEELSR